MTTVTAKLLDPSGEPFQGTLTVSRKYPRLTAEGSYVPMEIEVLTDTDGSIEVALEEGLHTFSLVPEGFRYATLFFDAYVPKLGTVELYELYRPYGYEEPEKVSRPWDESLTALTDAYRVASGGTVPMKTAQGWDFVAPAAGGSGGGSTQAAWGSITGSLTAQGDLVSFVNAGVATRSPLGHAHSINDVTGLAGSLDAKANVSHTQPIGSITGLDAALAAKADATHSHSADQVTSGTFDVARIPSLPASQITSGVLDTARVPGLPASQITSGVLDTARVPLLDASQIATGVLSTQRIPLLPAAQISEGTLAIPRIPDLSALYQPAAAALAQIVAGVAGAPVGAVPTRQANGSLAYAVPSGGSGGGGSSVTGTVFIGQISDIPVNRQNLVANTWTTIRLNATFDPGLRWDAVNNVFLIPATGSYLCFGRIRLEDGIQSTTFGQGIHTANDDASWIQWTPTAQNSGARRNSSQNMRIAVFNENDPVRLYCNLNTFTSPIIFAEMYLVRIS